jgi:N-acylneuraminate-9-phosphatase
MPYKCLFLDLDDTLCDTKGADNYAVQEFALYLYKEFKLENSLKIAQQFLYVIYNTPDDFTHEALRKSNTSEHRALLLEFVLHAYGVKNMQLSQIRKLNATFKDIRMHHFDYFKGVKNRLVELKSKYKLVLITNGPPYSQRPKIDKTRIDKVVDHILVGDEQEHSKPHPSIFESALNFSGCNKDEVIHIGDSTASDIQGANNFGIDSIWINADNKKIPESVFCNWEFHDFLEASKIFD